MDTKELRETLNEAIVDYLEDYDFDMASFKECGVLTSDEGLVMTFNNGDEFQITIVQSKLATQKQNDQGEKCPECRQFIGTNTMCSDCARFRERNKFAVQKGDE